MLYERKAQGLDLDDARAKVELWWTKAAGAGHLGAQRNLGVLFEREARVASAKGAASDLKSEERHHKAASRTKYKQAFDWYEKAARQGDVHSQRRLGELCHEGRGCKRSNVSSKSCVTFL
jgi:TPR repeat protein